MVWGCATTHLNMRVKLDISSSMSTCLTRVFREFQLHN